MATWRKRLLAFLFGILIGMAIYEARADTGDWWLNLHLGSHHVGLNQWSWETNYFSKKYGKYMYTGVEHFDYNETNLGAGIGYEFHRNFEARAGFVDKNSFNHTTFYGGVNWHTSYHRPVYVGLFSGIASGYKDTITGGDNLLIGVVQPNIGLIAYERARVEIGVIPSGLGGTAETTVWTFSVGFKF